MNQIYRFFVFVCFVLVLTSACTAPPIVSTATLPPSVEAISLTPESEVFTETIQITATRSFSLDATLDLSSPTTPAIETKAPTVISEEPTLTPAVVATVTMTALPARFVELEGATLPAGFSFRKVVEVDRPIGLAFSSAGNFYVSTQLGELRVYQLDRNNSSFIDYANYITISGFRSLHGMAFHPKTNELYISTAGKISILRDTDNDGVEDQVIPFVDDLPFGLHQNNVPKFGPDGMLYIGVGSTCDACIETDSRSGTIMRFDPETGEGVIVASGLRNPFDVAFEPETGALFATDNGRDDLGDFDPAEELNHIVQGNDYGWPDCWNDLEGITCDGTTQATALFTAHSSVNNLLFYSGNQFPSDYTNSLFALNFGSFLVQVDTGLQRIKLTPDGQGGFTAETEWFLTMPPNSFPLGLAQGPDGAIYFGDYINGGIWRVSYGD